MFKRLILVLLVVSSTIYAQQGAADARTSAARVPVEVILTTGGPSNTVLEGDTTRGVLRVVLPNETATPQSVAEAFLAVMLFNKERKSAFGRSNAVMLPRQLFSSTMVSRELSSATALLTRLRSGPYTRPFRGKRAPFAVVMVPGAKLYKELERKGLYRFSSRR